SVMRSLRAMAALERAGGTGVAARIALGVAPHRRGVLALTLLRRLLVEFAPAQLCQNACLFAGTLEAPQGYVEILILTNTHARHQAPCLVGLAAKRVRDSKARKGRCPLRILGIESSCDESAAAVLDSERGLLSHELFSQVDLHRLYGGVVPELAPRDHVKRLLPLVRQPLAKAETRPSQPERPT